MDHLFSSIDNMMNRHPICLTGILFATIISFILGIVVAFLFIASHTNVPYFVPTSDDQSPAFLPLGEALIFPDGWSPVECASTTPVTKFGYTCQWVCKNDQGEYRECNPHSLSGKFSGSS